MGKLAYPAPVAPSMIKIDSFLGADLTNDASYISLSRSPDCANMIRQSAGKVRKWIGWHTVKQYDGQINGLHTFTHNGADTHLVHAGTKLYSGDTLLYSGMADGRSMSRQLAGRLIVADGKKLLMVYRDGDSLLCTPVENAAYVPTVVISRTAAGGGKAYQPVNLIGRKRKDSFVVTEAEKDTKTFQLSATGLDSIDTAEILQADGSFKQVAAFTADLTAGRITFDTAPGQSVVPGQDNVIITYSKTVADYADRINSCDIMTLYGVNGAQDRIFLAGGSLPGRDYYCRMDNPTYWGDVWYSVIGRDNSRIMGYSIINDRLATHTDRSDNDTNIVLRTGSLTEDGTAAFRLCGGYQGAGAASRYAFGILETEPLFLTVAGVMAVTPSDILGERYAQLRSYYLNGLLLKQDLSQAVATVYDRFYMLAVGGYLFALDGTQAAVEKNMPYSGRQYEGYYRTNVPARVLADIDGVLTFGTQDGRLCRFYTDYTSAASFNDDGEPIHARWTTPEIPGRNFYYKKRFRRISVMLGAAVRTGVQVKAVYDGTQETVMEYDGSARYFAWSQLQWSKFTWKNDTTSQIFTEKISIKPDNRKARFVFENDVANQPMGLYGATIEFTEQR